MTSPTPPSLLVSTLCAASAAHAQMDSAAHYPSRPVRVVVAVAPGGGIDTAARILVDNVRQRLGQPFVIDNRGGAAGNVGAGLVFNTNPDGHTILASSLSSITIAGLLARGI